MFKIGTSYKAKYKVVGKNTGRTVAKKGQILTCIADGHMKRLAYLTKSGTEVSIHVSQYSRKDFVISK